MLRMWRVGLFASAEMGTRRRRWAAVLDRANRAIILLACGRAGNIMRFFMAFGPFVVPIMSAFFLTQEGI